jgi:hypothetical protein
MSVKYCNAECQRNHWSTHKKVCKQRAAELRDEALFKDPPPNQGRLSHLFSTDAIQISMLHLASIRDYIILTNLQFCEGK